MKACLARFLTVFILLTLTSDLAAQRSRRSFDPERFLMQGDADLDGRLSLDEYQEFMRRSRFARMGPDAVERIFRRMDSDRDGLLSIAEYSRSSRSRFGRRSTRRESDNDRRPTAIDDNAAVTPEQERFFEKSIRPVFVKHCAECHSSESEEREGGLLLDSRSGIRRGGNSGPAVVPGQPDQSLLIQAVRYRDDDLQMPPDGKLPDAVIADLEAWIKMGAPDPRTDAVASRVPSHATIDLASAREFWSFRPPHKSAPPAVNDSDWPRVDMDRFLLAAMQARGLSPVADASRQRLLRRVTFDLIGLPPTPQDLDAFRADSSPDAFARVVDRLLKSPHFGERWGRHWLDVARFAESSGKTNFTYPQAWRYRDWVIDSFNSDKSYDQFVREQIAGDLLPAANDQERAERLIATGFLALGSKAHESQMRGQFTLDVIDEQIEATTRAFLGLTVACARCHDHKLDPITQRDYYALAGIFRSTRTCSGTLAGVFPNFNASPLIELPTEADVPSAITPLNPDQRSRMEERLDALNEELDALPRGQENRNRQRRLNTFLSTLRHRLLMDRPGDSPRAFAMGVQERYEPVNSPLYIRGELEQPGAVVPRGLISVLITDSAVSVKSGSGRRELADWLASPKNPLTARVMVNRVWLHLFGRGLVATPDNFGSAGARPSHPELLDTLAADFISDGWSIKRLIRRIVLSRAYALDSAHDARNFEADPDNVLVWRMPKRRLEAEVVRDSLLFVAGNLETTPPVGSMVARVGEGLTRFLPLEGHDASDTHRSVYLPIVRDEVQETLAIFDFADPSLVTGQRATTTGPAQALYFMNGPLVTRQAGALAARVLAIDGDESQCIATAYRLAFSREPTESERTRAIYFLCDSAMRIGGADATREAWSLFCQALFASAEFRYVD